MKRIWNAGLTVLASATCFAQQPVKDAGLRFEVASVKQIPDWPPASTGPGERGAGAGCPTSMKIEPARIDFKCVTLPMLIGYAYRISPDRVQGTDWMMSVGSPRYRIEATLPTSANRNQIPAMFQTLLAERFKLVLHRSTADLPVYALVIGRGGLKIAPARPQLPADAEPPLDDGGFYGDIQSRTLPKADGREPVTLITSPQIGSVSQTGDPYQLQRWEAGGISMPGLTALLEQVAPLSLPVIDMTGLNGRYQLTLEVSLRELRDGRRRATDVGAAPAANDPMLEMQETVLHAFNDGLQKLGLRLEHRKARVPTLIVDHAEKRPTEN